MLYACFTSCFARAKALISMLCSLGFAVSNIEDFDNMSKYLQALDKIVETSGIFKSMRAHLYLIIHVFTCHYIPQACSKVCGQIYTCCYI